MKAIFAYKILNHFWKPKDEYFWKISKLAVEQASKFYPTVLYADSNTYKVFTEKGIVFDEFVDSTELFKDITEHTYGLPKILTMIEQDSAYLMLDLDTVLFSRVSSNEHVAFGHKEINVSLQKPIDSKISDVEYLEEYYKNSFDAFSGSFSLKLKHIDWDNYPSNSLVIVNSPKLVSEVYKKILAILGRELKVVPPKYTVQFYEQFFFYNLLREYKINVEFLYESPPGEFLTQESRLLDIYTYKYLHLDRYVDDKVKQVVDLLTKKTLF